MSDSMERADRCPSSVTLMGCSAKMSLVPTSDTFFRQVHCSETRFFLRVAFYEAAAEPSWGEGTCGRGVTHDAAAGAVSRLWNSVTLLRGWQHRLALISPFYELISVRTFTSFYTQSFRDLELLMQSALTGFY